MNIIDRIHETAKTKGPAGLPRMRRLLELLGNPEENLKIFHIGGTNGKGSASFFLKAILEAEGYSVGIYTSPHVKKYNERFQISGAMISDEDLERYAGNVLDCRETVIEEGLGNFSLFEIMTAIAYQFFAEHEPDYVIMEVGIGGRIDVTNTIEKPLVSIITQIGFDHTEILGSSLAEIATEKAGIIKPGVPVVTQSKESEVRDVIYKIAMEKGADVIDVSLCDYSITEPIVKTEDGIFCRFDATIAGVEYKGLETRMLGEHQVRNGITAALAVAEVMPVSEEAIRKGFKAAYNPGRFEFLTQKEPYIVIDGAHNSNGIKAAIEAYRTTLGTFVDDNKLIVSFGCLKDKDYDIMVEMIADAFCNASLIALQPDSERAVPAEELRELFEAKGCRCTASPKPESLFEPEVLDSCDAILALGSIYLIGEIKSLFDERN